ncbi:hypothetical protein cypCar_00040237 [Cyprinus carpio]|nr:hypothetical protein cypCar_00040237 [Cyprinus carpio]
MFAHSSPGCHSHLYNSIRSYLLNQNRAQPIIGLNSITEVLAYNQPALYFCDVCILRITKADIRNHIMGSIHRYNYIKSHHAHGWTSDTDLTLLARPLMDIAKKVEKKEGTGDIQVLSVDAVIYKEMASLPVPDAFVQMKKIKDQPNPNAPNLLVHNSPSEEEPQSDTLAEENTFVFSQSPIAQSPLTQTQSPSDQFQSKEDFLENYNGRKPLIGLQAIIKCQSVDGNPPPCCYLCQLCSLKLKKKKIFRHLTGCDHQRNYLKALHPKLLPKKHKHCNTNEMLEDIAIQLEKEDGRGHIKVMRLSACLMSEVLEKDYHWCMRVLNCGADVGWRSGLLSLKEGTNKTTGSSQTLKRPAESMLPPSDARAFIAPAGAPTHQMSKKIKKDHPKKVVCTNKVKEPVFKVSLSLQEGPVIIERTSLRETTTVAPEIEDQSPATTCTDNDAPPLETNTHSEVQMSFHSCMYETQFTNPAHYAYSGQFDQSQVIQCLEPSLRPRDCGPVDEVVTVTYADWPLQDWSCNNNQWIVMRQNRDGSDYSECTSYMQY